MLVLVLVLLDWRVESSDDDGLVIAFASASMDVSRQGKQRLPCESLEQKLLRRIIALVRVESTTHIVDHTSCSDLAIWKF